MGNRDTSDDLGASIQTMFSHKHSVKVTRDWSLDSGISMSMACQFNNLYKLNVSKKAFEYVHKCRVKLDRMVERVKPWFMVLFMGLFMVGCTVWFMVWFMVHGSF